MQRVLVRATAALLMFMLCIARASWRIDHAGIHKVNALLSDGEPTIVAFWHGHMVPLLALLRDQPAIVLSSSGFRGSVIAQIATSFGHRSVQIEGGNGATALSARLRTDSAPIAIAVDGPLGPYHRAKPGVVVLSALAEARVLPIAANVRPAFRLWRWDRLIIPVPFAAVCLRVGRPMRFKKADLQTMDAATTALSEKLCRLSDGRS